MSNVYTVLALGVYIVLLVVIGLSARRVIRSTTGFEEEYYVGGRSMGAWTIALTTAATWVTAGTVIATAGVAYETGYNWVYVVSLQIPLGWMILGVLGKKFAIVARKIRAVTVVDFLRQRYESRLLVLFVSLGTVFFLSAYIVAQLAAGARVLEAAAGIDYRLGLTVFAIVTVLYTLLGGFRAVAYSDVLQGIVMLVGGVALFIGALRLAGGLGNITQTLANADTGLVTLPGAGGQGSLIWAVSYGTLMVAMIVIPHAAVRGMAFKDSRALHGALIVGPFIVLTLTLIFGLMGPIARALHPGLAAGDLAVPTMVIDVFPPWAAGVFLAAPMAAMMSSVDSLLLVVASAIVKDIYINYVRPNATRIRGLNYATMLVVGVVTTAFAYSPPEFIQFIVLFAIGGVGAAVAGPLLFGLYWKRANLPGALASAVGGMVTYAATEVFIANGSFQPFALALPVLILLMIGVSLATAPPEPHIVRKFWGRGMARETDISVGTS